MANQQPSSTNFPPTKVATATLQPLTYYPLTPDELVSLSNLPVSRPAFLLLLYIKTNAPFGKPRRFTDSFNLRTMAAALKEFSRTTFWRARSQLVDKGLIELDDYSVRDSHTVNRQQFENSRRAKSAEVNVSEMLTLVSPVADLKRSLQACNERPLEPASSNSSDSYKQIKSISSNLNRKTTKHSQVPTSHPEVCFLADSSKIEERGQNDIRKNSPKRKQDFEAKSAAQNPASTELFSQLEPNLKDLGITRPLAKVHFLNGFLIVLASHSATFARGLLSIKTS